MANYNEMFHSAESGEKSRYPVQNEVPPCSFRRISGEYFENAIVPKLMESYHQYRATGIINGWLQEHMQALSNNERKLLPLSLLGLVEFCDRALEITPKREVLGLLDCLQWEFGIQVPKYDASMN